MFIGHFAVGFAAKRSAPALSLGWLFLAVQFADLLWPSLLLPGVEQVAINHEPNQHPPLIFTHYPISHSLLMSFVWAFLLGLVYYLFNKNFRNASVLSLCVLSHWVLDLIAHYPDLPLYPGDSLKVGLKLWSLPVLENCIEALMFIIGLALYLKTTRAKNNTGKYVLWILVTLLVAVHIANALGPAPDNVNSLAWAAQFMWVFVLLAFWVDHNRTEKIAQWR